MNISFEHSDFLNTEIAAQAPWHHSDTLVKITEGTFARFDSIKLSVLNGSLTATLSLDGVAIGTYNFRRSLMDEYVIDGLFAHVKVDV
jgi:hypothetical protein